MVKKGNPPKNIQWELWYTLNQQFILVKFAFDTPTANVYIVKCFRTMLNAILLQQQQKSNKMREGRRHYHDRFA